MERQNIIWVFNHNKDKVLMCKRRNAPYKGLFNLVGGKVNPFEEGRAAAYRELREETGITGIDLIHIMDFTYYTTGHCIEVWAGRLEWDIEVHGDENELVWIDLTRNLFEAPFAGEGKLGHIYDSIKAWEDSKKLAFIGECEIA